MSTKFNMRDKLNKIRNELDIRLINIPKRYSYTVDFNYYYEKLYIKLDFLTGEILEPTSWEKEEILELEYEKNMDNNKLIEDIVTKINNHISKNYLDEINRNKLKDITIDIMEEYSSSVEMVNEIDELCYWDYEIYDLEQGIQCGADVFHNDLCINIYYDKVYDVNEEKIYECKTENELIKIIKTLTIDFLNKEEEKMKKIIKEQEDEDYDEDYYKDYEPPESYPDWDGDESIMYYIEHYNELDNEDED